MNWYLMVLKKYAEFSGRSRRKECWMFFLINIIISMILGLVGGMIEFIYLSNIYSLVVLIPAIAVGVRRMHDVNKSGWFILIPIYNIILACTAGDAGPNRFGADPKGQDSFNQEALDSHLTN